MTRTWSCCDLGHMPNQKSTVLTISSHFSSNMLSSVCHAEGRSEWFYQDHMIQLHLQHVSLMAELSSMCWIPLIYSIKKDHWNRMCCLERNVRRCRNVWVDVWMLVKEKRFVCLCFTAGRTHKRTQNCDVTIPGRQSDVTQHLVTKKV